LFFQQSDSLKVKRQVFGDLMVVGESSWEIIDAVANELGREAFGNCGNVSEVKIRFP
jgi:hypothetical protein